MIEPLREPLYAVAHILDGQIRHMEAGPFVNFLSAFDACQEFIEDNPKEEGEYHVVQTKPVTWE